MDFKPLRYNAPLTQYEAQAENLFDSYEARDAKAYDRFRKNLPRFMDPEIPWMSTNPSDPDIEKAHLSLEDAQLTLAREYSLENWQSLAAYVSTVRSDPAVLRFEAAVEAVIDGDVESLRKFLEEDPQLVHARSARRNNFDPPVHRATLLHYVAANGVEGYRQRTPKNAVEIARLLLDSGAEVDALADMYGSPCTPMSMLVSSAHPAAAGVQVALTELLLDSGAAIEGAGTDKWGTPLMTALVFGYPDTADALARRGARVDHLPVAAGLGRVDEVRRLLPGADEKSRHSALALSAQLGRTDVVQLLLDAGEDPNRFNPENHHAHSTPLHQASLAGHLDVVRLLVERGARLDVRDKNFDGTPLGWALHGGQTEVAAYLRSKGAVE